MRTIRIGSRASRLALVQAELIIDGLREKFPQYQYEIIKIITKGDKILDKTLDKIGGKGLFVREIQKALIDKEIDLAVHSMKDMPADSPEGLMLGAITKREDPRDVLVTKNHIPWSQLPTDARIGSSSLRRQAQLLNLNGCLKIEPIRGNVETRISKIETQTLDGVILAAAGLNRLGLTEEIAHYFNTEEFVPAVGQGALGCEIRKDDEELYNILQELNHKETYNTVMAERSFLKVMEGGCHVPIGAYGKKVGEELQLTGMVGAPNGKEIIKETEIGGFDDFVEIGRRLAEKMQSKGAKELLEEVANKDPKDRLIKE
ncbi:hydroxymethylbilane synthase [Alkaliphilus hydrothermalis]|uniref:Porphobilinogen deaminase n=1 Tax=Alkaliphilus hydrothermalis TaxID=1482730 RepID=A0ABS2NP38_9FIRM|nr:hydroxymethylbilane synthase [Alkaliphilus hydrothermalis]MBM7614716.1 hydroxymethylbilane synthase [Alkaliphilus hydrothermalis]